MAAFEGIGGRDRHAPPRYQTPPANFATEPYFLLEQWNELEIAAFAKYGFDYIWYLCHI